MKKGCFLFCGVGIARMVGACLCLHNGWLFLVSSTLTDGERMESLSMVGYKSLSLSQRETRSLLMSIGGEGTMDEVAGRS